MTVLPSQELCPPTFIPTSASRCPAEVYNLIIDNLHDDIQALSHCSLVSSYWLIRSRYWLFKDVEIPVWWNDCLGVWGRITDTIVSPKSTCAPHIRRLSIVGNDFGDRLRRRDYQADTKPYEPLNEFLQQILPRLPNIEVLTIRQIVWSCVDPHNRQLIQSLPLVTLSWSQVAYENLAELIEASCHDSFPGLKELKINEVGFRERNSYQLDYTTLPKDPFSGIRSLNMQIHHPLGPLMVVTPGSRLLPLDQIHTLSLTVHESNVPPIADFIAACNNLTSLELNHFSHARFHPGEPQLLFPIRLAHNIHLKYLTISPQVRDCDIPWVIDIIDSIPATTCPVSISLSLSTDDNWDLFDFTQLQNSILRRSAGAHSLRVIFPRRSLSVDSDAEVYKRSFKELEGIGKLVVIPRNTGTRPPPALLAALSESGT